MKICNCLGQIRKFVCIKIHLFNKIIAKNWNQDTLHLIIRLPAANNSDLVFTCITCSSFRSRQLCTNISGRRLVINSVLVKYISK